MKTSLMIGTAILALSLIPLGTAHAQLLGNGSTQSQALTIDPQRGVLTMAPLLERVTPAVVSIEIEIEPQSRRNSQRSSDLEREFFERFFGRPPTEEDGLEEELDPDSQARPRRSVGSGVIIDASKGLVLTNNHVIDDADGVYVTLLDKRSIEAEIVGTDENTDIALLKIDARDLTALTFGKTENVRVGDYAIAVGNPFGLSHTVTSGIISAIGRDQARNREAYTDYIQTDASINPGNSGGALINSKGELIGINTAIISRSGTSSGIGFAIPTRIVESVMGQLERYGEVRRGRIGINISPITSHIQQAFDLPTRNGALVNNVVNDSPAQKAGIMDGDIIVEFNNTSILDSSDIRNAVGLLEPGARVDIIYLRDGKRITSKITVEAQEDEEDETPNFEAVSLDATERFSGAELTNIPNSLELRGGNKGVYVTGVIPGSKAQQAGLFEGDVIRAVKGKKVDNLKDFLKEAEKIDGPIGLSVERDGINRFLAIR